MRDILYAYELMDIATIRRTIRLKKMELDNTGGWIDLTKVVQLVLLCRGIGEVISLHPTKLDTCWLTVPTHSYVLCATVKCLTALSDDVGGVPHRLTQDREWHCAGSLFEACIYIDAKICPRLQQVVPLGKARIPSQPFSTRGAVVFGNRLKSDPHQPSRSSDTNNQDFHDHQQTVPCIHNKSQHYESAPHSRSPSTSNRASSHQRSSIYSLGMNPPLLSERTQQSYRRTNIAFSRSFSTMH